MRIISKACYLLKGEGKAAFRTSPLLIQDVPDWVKDDLTFINAVKNGNIQVLDKGLQTKATEKKQEELTGTIAQQIEQFSSITTEQAPAAPPERSNNNNNEQTTPNLQFE